MYLPYQTKDKPIPICIRPTTSCLGVILLSFFGIVILTGMIFPQQTAKIVQRYHIFELDFTHYPLTRNSEIDPNEKISLEDYYERHKEDIVSPYGRNPEMVQLRSEMHKYGFCALRKNAYRMTGTMFFFWKMYPVCKSIDTTNMTISQLRMACLHKYEQFIDDGDQVELTETDDNMIRIDFKYDQEQIDSALTNVMANLMPKFRHVLNGQKGYNHTWVIVRDPIDRLISSYLDVCHVEKNCFDDVTKDFALFVKRLHSFFAQKFRYKRDPEFKKFDEEYFDPQSWRCPIDELKQLNHVVKFCHGKSFAKDIDRSMIKEGIPLEIREKLTRAMGRKEVGNYYTMHFQKRKDVENVLAKKPAVFQTLLKIYWEDYKALREFFPFCSNFECWRQNCCNEC